MVRAPREEGRVLVLERGQDLRPLHADLLEHVADVPRVVIARDRVLVAHVGPHEPLRTLLELPDKLKEYTGFDTAWIDDDTELVLEMRDTVRAEIYLADDLLLPGMTKPLRPQRP